MMSKLWIVLAFLTGINSVTVLAAGVEAERTVPVVIARSEVSALAAKGILTGNQVREISAEEFAFAQQGVTSERVKIMDLDVATTPSCYGPLCIVVLGLEAYQRLVDTPNEEAKKPVSGTVDKAPGKTML